MSCCHKYITKIGDDQNCFNMELTGAVYSLNEPEQNTIATRRLIDEINKAKYNDGKSDLASRRSNKSLKCATLLLTTNCAAFEIF